MFLLTVEKVHNTYGHLITKTVQNYVKELSAMMQMNQKPPSIVIQLESVTQMTDHTLK